MGFWAKLLGQEKFDTSPPKSASNTVEASGEPEVRYEDIPGTLDLGWYYSENQNEVQMAKIPERDRSTHCYVVGATGSGKTKFLEFLIWQDIKNGNGFGVIDPHGDLIEDIKGFLACRYREYRDEEEISDRLVLVDPTDTNYTVTFNPLEKLAGVSVAEQANELVSSFRKIWSDSWGVRMEDLMRNSLIALGEVELTLADLPHFLTRRGFRESVLENVSHPICKEYFQRFDSITDRSQITWIEPVMNKVNAFLSDDRIRKMFASSKSSFNLRSVMDHRNMLLVKLDKGKLKDSADLLGSLLMTKIQMAAFSRSDTSQGQRTPFYLYIDEFQNFASESFAVILSEARKYGLSLIMAHQTLAQISPELRSLILGNTGIQVFFRVNRQDAQLLAKEAFEYSGYEVKTVRSFRPNYWSLGEEWEHYFEELQTLPPRVCVAKHKIAGGLLPLRTVDIEPAWEILAMEEAEYHGFVKNLPFGKKYLVNRDKLNTIEAGQPPQTSTRTEARPKEGQREVGVQSMLPLLEQGETKKPPDGVGQDSETETTPAKVESQHKKLQNIIKRLAEERGYRVTIEQPTSDGLGRVDVSLEKDGRRIACEVSVTTTGDWELGNIEKCLAAGYDKIILCSPHNKILERVKALVLQKLKDSEKDKVVFLKAEQVSSFLNSGDGSSEEETQTGTQDEEELPVNAMANWESRVWYALKHLDDRSALNQCPLARLGYIQRLAEREYKGNILVKGLALRETLIKCVDKIIAEGSNEPGLEKVCQFLKLLKETPNVSTIAGKLGLSREQVTRVYKKKAVELVTQEFLRVAKTRHTK